MSAQHFPRIWVPNRTIANIVHQRAPDTSDIIDASHPFAHELKGCYLASHFYHDGTNVIWPSLVQPTINADAPIENMFGASLSVGIIDGFPAIIGTGGLIFGGSDDNNSMDPNGIDFTILILWNSNNGGNGRNPLEKDNGGPGSDFHYQINTNDTTRISFKGGNVALTGGTANWPDFVSDWVLWYIAVDEAAATVHSYRLNLTRFGLTGAGGDNFTSGTRGTTDRGRNVGQTGAGALGGLFFWHRFITREEAQDHVYQLFDMLRPATEIIQPGKAAAGLSLVKFAPDSVDLAEGVLRPRAMSRFGPDNEDISEAAQGSLGLIRFGDDDVDVAEGLLAIRGLVRFIDETEEAAEVVQRLLGIKRLTPDGINIAEGLIRSRVLVRFGPDTENLVEALVRARAVARFSNEVAELSEATQGSLGLLRFGPDTVNIAEAIGNILGLVRLVAEGIDISENIVRLVRLLRFAPDGIDIAEAALRPRAMSRFSDETQQIAEGLIRAMALVRLIPEGIDVAEVNQASLALLRLIDETEEIGEGLVEKLLAPTEGFSSFIAEILHLAELTIPHRSLVRFAAADTEEIGEATHISLGLKRFSPDTEEVSEEVLEVRGFVESSADTEQIAEGVVAVLAAPTRIGTLKIYDGIDWRNAGAVFE